MCGIGHVGGATGSTPLGGASTPPITPAPTVPTQGSPKADPKLPEGSKDAIAGALGGATQVPDAAKGADTLQTLLTKLVDLLQSLITLIGNDSTGKLPDDGVAQAGGWWRP